MKPETLDFACDIREESLLITELGEKLSNILILFTSEPLNCAWH